MVFRYRYNWIFGYQQVIDAMRLAPNFENLFVQILRSGQGVQDFKNVSTSMLEETILRLNARILKLKGISSEHIVLIRQIARWSGKNIFVGEIHTNFANLLEGSGIHLNSVGELVSEDYRPSWIKNEDWNLITSLDEIPINSKPDEKIPAEPWLNLVNLQKWNSPAQKDACWTVLNAKQGSTTLVALPTGAGKSLCFQLLSAASSGLTMVIVPTTALAIDQYFSSKKLFGDNFRHINPMYYVADDPNLTAETVRREVKHGSCRLLFTSPEAFVSGSLKNIVFELASQGQLSNLVIDEAHIIESWGRHFRVDFQFLSAVRQQLLLTSEGRLKTFLFSATFTEQTICNLRKMFSEENNWSQLICQRLRPEMRYYSAVFGDLEHRKSALIEAVRHLPRPLIIYVTKKDDCEEICQLLKENGFPSTDLFHGDTDKQARRRILLDWQDDQLDIIVATSAFGMGVDKQNVRAIIHACFPESVDRFYQEVGRGGRDGFSSISLWMPCLPLDRRTAMGIRPKVLTDDVTISKRWDALLSNSERDTENSRLKLRMDAKRNDFWGKQTGSEDRNWNKSLILMFVPSGVFKLINVERIFPDNDSDTFDEYDLVEIEYFESPTSPKFLTLLEDQIANVREESNNDFNMLDSILTSETKICRALRKIYGRDTIKVCAGSMCQNCRDVPFDVIEVPTLTHDKKLINESRHEILKLPTSWHSKQYRQEFDELLLYALDKGIDAFVFPDSMFDDALNTVTNEYRADLSKLYRFENEKFIEDVVLQSTERIMWFHDGNFDRSMVKKNLSPIVTHVLTNEIDLMDNNKRLFFSHERVHLFNDIDVWKGTI